MTLAPWQRYIARVRAHLLAYPDHVLCLESAAALHGLPIIGGPHDIHVLGDGTATSRCSDGVRVHTAALSDRIIDQVDGVRLTSPADTCVDIARLRHPAAALAVCDAAARLDEACRAPTLVTVNEGRGSSRGRRHARWALPRTDPAAESPLESLSRAAIEWSGFAAPELQVWFDHADGSGDRSDMWWSSQAVVGEADGHVKYDGRFGDPAVALRARHRRDRRLREAGARTVLHWTWDDVASPDALSRMLRGAGLPLVGPRDTFRLQGLAALLRSSPGTPAAPSD